MLATETDERDDPMPVFNKVKLGKRLRAARYLAGYDKAQELADALSRELGDEYSKDAIYRVERGETMPSVELMFGILIVCEPPGGVGFLEVAVQADQKDAFGHLVG